MALIRTAVAFMFTCIAFVGVSRAATTSTLENLQAAFNGESNAHARYLAFAEQADGEGYHQVASLFRAAATAEQIHADNHARVIRGLGGEPKADIAKPVVKTTKENLTAAIAGESYERDTMYPEFIATAEAASNAAAVRTFKHARTAEMHHAELYAKALGDLDGWREGARTFYVCEVCGETLTARPDVRCPSCGTTKEKFKVVS